MAQVVIIGAGLTGISTAYHLEQKGFTEFKLFEKESEPGGLCRSIEQDGFTFDYTGHLLHTGDAYFKSLIDQISGLNNFNVINRRAFIYSHERYSRYPYQINLYGLPTKTIADCIEGYINRPIIKNPVSFREWVITTFGQGFGKHFFFSFQEKIFATNIDQLTSSWTKNFVPKTSLNKILYGALEDQGDTPVGYNAQFYYPKIGGIFAWVNQFAKQLKQPIYTNMQVESIDIINKSIKFSSGHIEPYETLINTMPLDRLLACLKEPSSSFLRSAKPYLQCNQVINYNLGINRPDVSDKHWIYFPERKFPFYRLGFPTNFSAQMAPDDCSSIYGEFSHKNKSAQWVKKTLKESISLTKKLLGISNKEIVTERIIPISHAYVTYDHWREENIGKLHTELNKQNIYSIGRYGEWKYGSMQDAVLDGREMAQKISAQYHPILETSKPQELHD